MFHLRNNLSWRNILLFQIDAILIFASVCFAFSLAAGVDFQGVWSACWQEALVITFLCQLILLVSELYDATLKLTKFGVFLKVAVAFGISAIILKSFYFLFPQFELAQSCFGYAMLISVLVVGGWRMIYGWLECRVFTPIRVIIYGSGSPARMIAQEMKKYGNPIYEVVGFANDAPEHIGLQVMGHKVISGSKELLDAVAKLKVSKIVVAINQRRGVFPSNTLLECKLRGVKIVDLPDLYEKLTGKILIRNLRPSWFIFSSGFRKSPFYLAVKRSLDVFFASVGMVLTFPLMLITAGLIALDSPGPILFKQTRAGEHGKKFLLLKFRSMYYGAEDKTGPMWAQEDDKRITRVGKFIRRFRVDELPQLINVLEGDMSFVGPRPERPFFIQKLQELVPYYTQRLTVKPGITGWAAVKFQYSSSIEAAVEKLQYDLYYIKNISLALDLWIVLKTVQVMLMGKGSR